jgi:hypothetical protein
MFLQLFSSITGEILNGASLNRMAEADQSLGTFSTLRSQTP